MKFVHKATEFPATEEYDYIVIGGGNAGCPLAASLLENFSVLVLERGNVPTAYPTVLNASGFLSNLRQDDDGNTPPKDLFRKMALRTKEAEFWEAPAGSTSGSIREQTRSSFPSQASNGTQLPSKSHTSGSKRL